MFGSNLVKMFKIRNIAVHIETTKTLNPDVVARNKESKILIFYVLFLIAELFVQVD
jgi:hypothetical protein